jgi:hypothetical protein
MFNMAKCRRAQRKDWRSYLGVGYNLDTEDVGEPRAAVVSESAKYEVLALLIEYENT